MFGTLVSDVRSKEALVFVENTDQASALSRSRREKIHISCVACRARKVRCSGQPSGCDRCAAVFAECRYPAGEGRRRKSSTNSSAAPSRQSPQPVTTAAGLIGTVSNSPPPHTTIDEMPENMQGWLNLDTDIPDALSMALLESSGLDVGMDDATWDSLTQEASRLIESSADTSPDDALSTNPAISPLLQQQSLGDPERWHSAPDLNRWFVDHHQEPLLTPMPSATSSHHNHPPPPQQQQQRRQSDAPTASAPPRPKPTCHCLQLAASLLEDLSDKGACSFGGLSSPCSSPAPPLDVLLHFSRRALNRAAAIVACERCASLSEANMLLAMATQYMSTIFERVVKGCIEMQRASSKSGGRRGRASRSASPLGEDGGWGSESGSSGGGGGGAAAAADHHMWFSSYCIENAGERAAAVQGLASVQLGEYLRMLRTLKARAAGRPGHLVLLSEADQKIKAVRAMMRAGLMLSSSDRPGSKGGQELGSLLDP